MYCIIITCLQLMFTIEGKKSQLEQHCPSRSSLLVIDCVMAVSESAEVDVVHFLRHAKACLSR